VIVAGIDSAELTGFAVVVAEPGGRERLLRHGTLKIRKAADVERAVAELAGDRPDLVAIEAPFIGVNVTTGLTLATLLGRWLQSWETRGVPTTTATASVWQTGVLSGLITPCSNRAERKAACRTWCKATFSGETRGVNLTEDEADAIGLATFAVRRAVLAAKVRAA
jgi:Holliday junction resolvasome RuvABC endonuclease subunit